MNRRGLMAATLLLGSSAPRAAVPPIASLGVYSLVGDAIELTFADPPTDSRIERSNRQSFEVKQIGFDSIVLRVVREAVLRRHRDARVMLFKAPSALDGEAQRSIVAGARKAEMPAWIMQTAERDKLAHLLVIGRHRADAAFPVLEGHSLGRSKLDGVGFHVDSTVSIQNANNRAIAQGLLGVFALFEMVLVDAVSGDLLADTTAHEQQGIAPPVGSEANDPWNRLAPAEKVRALRWAVEHAARRGIDKVLGSA